MKEASANFRERLTEGLAGFGLARWIIVAFILVLWFVAGVFTSVDLGTLFGDCLVRGGMNGILVLALVLPVRAGNGLNFGLPLGIVCGLVGGIAVLELAAEHPFGIESIPCMAETARGWSGFLLTFAVAIPLAALAGWGYGRLLEKVRGSEMMVGIYVGFGAVAGLCVLWLNAPLTSQELIWPLGGEGVRNTILLDDYYKWILDGAGEISFGPPAPPAAETGLPSALFLRSGGFFLPTGLLVAWLGVAGLLAAFLRTRLGIAMTAAGANPNYARSIGIPVARMRVTATTLSTVLAAVGIIVYSQSYGFYQLYKAPLWMAFPTVAALLLGGASLGRATVFHAVVGVTLFQSIMTTSLPVVNDLVQNSTHAGSLSNLPEIASTVIQNGVILYALSRARRGGG